MIFFTSQESKDIFNGMKYLNLSFWRTCAYSLPFQKCYTDQCVSFFFNVLVFLDTRVNDRHRKPWDTTMTQTSAAWLARESTVNSLRLHFPLPNWRTAPSVRTDMRVSPRYSIHSCTKLTSPGSLLHSTEWSPSSGRVWIQIQTKVGLKKKKLWEYKCYRTNPTHSAADFYQCHSTWQFSWGCWIFWPGYSPNFNLLRTYFLFNLLSASISSPGIVGEK